MDEGWIDHQALLGMVQEVVQVAQVTMTSSYPIPSTVLIQNKHLTRAKPALKWIKQWLNSLIYNSKITQTTLIFNVQRKAETEN